ncbi:unnamed protein product [Gongylonema pulchrum]|uniref:Serpentine receptor class gamma n=1 Tax=Gongylonema pulchrum TaxID=637853 RepID=A0A183CWN0_9BILA|nr:unnamed protein product [Gongylonema pulchrum]
MPSLVVFGRRWNIASDDFVFPSLSEALVRLAWVTTTCIIFMLKKWRSCADQQFLIFIFSLIGVNSVTVLVCFILALASARGSILEPQKRHLVAKILYIRLPLFIVEIAVTAAATVFAFSKFFFFVFKLNYHSCASLS